MKKFFTLLTVLMLQVFMAATIFATPIPGGTHGKVLICGAEADNSYLADVQTKIQSTGIFTTVDVFNVYTGTPTLAQLQDYVAVLVFSDYDFADATALGNNLAAYVDGGGGVVSSVFSQTAIAPIQGNFNTDTYLVIDPNTWNTDGDTRTLGTVLLPAHPIMHSVTSFNGGESSFRTPTTLMSSGSYRIADYDDGEFLL